MERGAKVNIARLRELCDAFDNGSINQDHHPKQMRELVGLAREAAKLIAMTRAAAHGWNALREITRASFDHKEALRICAKELLKIVGE